jgi:GR25 family glycosyltransferase involved in LPS biosynthesis
MKSYIICLSKIEASLTTATNLKQRLEEFDMPAELFEGTYGNDAVKIMNEQGRTIHPFGIKGPSAIATETAIEDNGKISSPGVRGCFLSHYRLWQKCAELNEPIIIWEDDIVLSRPYKPVDWQDVLVVALGHPKKSERYIDYLTNPIGDPQAMPYRNSSMPGCCGYALKPHAAQKLVDTYANTYLPADNAINQHHVIIEIHNYIMGTALVGKAVKKSLTRTNYWNEINESQ